MRTGVLPQGNEGVFLRLLVDLRDPHRSLGRLPLRVLWGETGEEVDEILVFNLGLDLDMDWILTERKTTVEICETTIKSCCRNRILANLCRIQERRLWN